MEYLDGCNTTIRRVARKVGLYDSEVVSPQGRYFQTGRLAYDIFTLYQLIIFFTSAQVFA